MGAEPDVVVLGNGVAGYTCAARLARNGLRPLLVGPGLPADRPPLSKAALVSGEPRLFADEETLPARGIDRLDGAVVDVDLDGLSASVLTAGGAVTVRGSAIVLALGLEYVPPPVPGLEDAYVNATPEGLRRLVPQLAGGAKRILVVGGGLIGVESAATLATAGHDVTVIDMTERPMERLHDPIPSVALAALEATGARFVGGVRIESAELGAGGEPSITTTEHGVLRGDLVIAATGGRSVRLAGLGELGVPIEVDGDMRVPGTAAVYAIGDCAVPLHARFGRIVFPQWGNAIGTAERAADAICGIEGAYDRLPYWWSDIGSLTLAEVGIAAEAVEWREGGGMHVGYDAKGAIACALVVGQPRKLREARALFDV